VNAAQAEADEAAEATLTDESATGEDGTAEDGTIDGDAGSEDGEDVTEDLDEDEVLGGDDDETDCTLVDCDEFGVPIDLP
jgi:hypothetical protein